MADNSWSELSPGFDNQDFFHEAFSIHVENEQRPEPDTADLFGDLIFADSPSSSQANASPPATQNDIRVGDSGWEYGRSWDTYTAASKDSSSVPSSALQSSSAQPSLSTAIMAPPVGLSSRRNSTSMGSSAGRRMSSGYLQLGFAVDSISSSSFPHSPTALDDLGVDDAGLSPAESHRVASLPGTRHGPPSSGLSHPHNHRQDAGINPRDVFQGPPPSPAAYQSSSATLFSPPYQPNKIYQEDIFQEASGYHEDGRDVSIRDLHDEQPPARRNVLDIRELCPPVSRPSRERATGKRPDSVSIDTSISRSTRKPERRPDSEPRKKLPTSSVPSRPPRSPLPVLVPRPRHRSPPPRKSSRSTRTESTGAEARSQLLDLPPAHDDRDAQDAYLLKKREQGLSYKEIRAMGCFIEAESTLRGRYRALTKEKDKRVRVPTWTNKDLKLLDKAVLKYAKGDDPHQVKIPWNKVAKYILSHGGSYQFGSATCHKVWIKENSEKEDEEEEDEDEDEDEDEEYEE